MNSKVEMRVFDARELSVLQEDGCTASVAAPHGVLSLCVGVPCAAGDAWLEQASVQRLTLIPLVKPFFWRDSTASSEPSTQWAWEWLTDQGARWLTAAICEPEQNAEPMQAVALLDASTELVSSALVKLQQVAAFDLAVDEPVSWLWHPWAIPPWGLAPQLSPRQPTDEAGFAAKIRYVAQERTGGGCSCTERHVLGNGVVVEHSFPMATGWRWLCRRAQYRKAFSQEMPCWTNVLHPATRGSLVQLALSLQRPMPALRPLREPLPRTKRAKSEVR